jgi:hypothetical protein
MKHTTDDDPDLPGLHGSLLKAEEIANMTEEIHTQLMKIFRRLLQSIQYCPVYIHVYIYILTDTNKIYLSRSP